MSATADSAIQTASIPLLRRTTCPHCWTSFQPADVLWISAHEDLHGDPRLGPEQLQRFLPTRFTIEGNAVDARGFVCHSLACPHCYLPVPRALLEIEPYIISILGAPACGKSYFLAAMTWELRRLLPASFALGFSDADTVSNRTLNEYEQSLFLSPRSDEPIPLADLIRKTEEQGELYNTVRYGNQTVSYPRPFLFTLQPRENHPQPAAARRSARLLCLYDNAGESFQAGKDSTGNPVTQHLAQSRLLLFLFDPTQDPRFRELCLENPHAAATLATGRSSRQETVLVEAAARIRRYAGLQEGARHNQPLILVLTKYDAWQHLVDDRERTEPLVRKDALVGLDRDRIERRSAIIRSLMQKVCPEVVNAADSFAQSVSYIPVSALGNHPILQANKTIAIRPKDIQPTWVTVPMLHGLSLTLPGLLPLFKRKQPPARQQAFPEQNSGSGLAPKGPSTLRG
jgi:hypothetical protein